MTRKTAYLSLIFLFLFTTVILSLSKDASAFNLPDTGQTICYQSVSPYDEIPCAGTGQDGAYNINPLSYTDNGNGTVSDNNTGLMWQKCSVGQNNDSACSGTALAYNWYKASGTYHATYNPTSQDVCGELTTGGYTDWRLPSKKELMSIVDYSIPSPGPTINPIFTNTKQSDYWSSTTYASYPDGAWSVGFGYGGSGYNLNKVNAMYVRCVRGGQSSASFVNNGNGTVTDTKTGLMWQQSAPGYMTWGPALSYCEGLSLGSSTDWRLPNIKELESITDDSRYNPSIDPVFTGTVASYYWSSTTIAIHPDDARVVHFYNGGVSDYGKDYAMYVRCVRVGQAGFFDHFEITDESGKAITGKAVDEQFQIKVTARNADGTVKTGWTGTVYISATNGGLSLSSVTISTGGTATVIVSNNTSGTNVQISAMGGGMSGTSSAFNITGGVACYGTVAGKVTQYKTPLSGATVYLTGYNYSEQRTSGADGSYSFANVPPGSYTLHAEYNGGESREIPVTVGCGGTAKDINVYQTCNPNEKTPVLLVPGIAGSTTGGPWNPIPTLPRDKSPQWTDPDLIIYDFSFETDHGWNNLETILTANGYILGCTLFKVPYDWRKDNDTVVEEYLQKWITAAKVISGSPKVNVIAHSQGGLVTRAYIQGANYNNDIDRFAMIATPNHGSAKAYYLWEGADPETLDETVGGLIGTYQKIVNYLVFGDPTSPLDRKGIYRLKVYEYMKSNVWSMWQLMPTYSFLDPLGNTECFPNIWLNNLNSSGNISRLTYETDPDTNKVKTKLFYSDSSNSTIETINAGKKDCSKLFYPDGEPNGAGFSLFGDTTVLGESARLPEADITEDPSKPGEHSKLVKTYATDAVDFIDYGQPVVTSALSKSAYAAQTASATSSLSLAVTGRAQPLLISPTAQKSGIDNGVPVSNIPGTEQSIGVDAATIGIENPVEGTYTVSMTGLHEEDYNIIIAFEDANGESAVLSRHGFNHANTTSFTFTLDSASADKITVNHTPLPPTNLQADAYESGGLKTALTWTASTDPAVTGYNIYARFDDEPYLAQIGTTAVNSYNTGDAWAENDAIVPSLYAISAIKADGTESFLSDMAENNDRDHDGLTDGQETSMGTNVSNPDTDGDGLMDGEEYTRGTNPLLTDTDGDGYSDYYEIQAGSDPLDKYSPKMNILVTYYYNSILNRVPEPGGAEGWTEEIQRIVSLGIDIKEGFIALGKLFFNSGEYLSMNTTNSAYVTDLYETFLGRTPSQSEADYWAGQLSGGLTRNLLLNYFIFSAEFKSYMDGLFGDTSVRPEYNLVNDLYRGFLSRLPDDGGFNNWLGQMQTAQCNGDPQAIRDLTLQLALLFLNSQEYANRNTSNSEYIEDLYNGILRRGAELSGYLYWLGALNGGTYTRAEMMQLFVDSVEFQTRVQQVIDAGCAY